MKMIEQRRVGSHGIFKAAALLSDLVGSCARRREHGLSWDALNGDIAWHGQCCIFMDGLPNSVVHCV